MTIKDKLKRKLNATRGVTLSELLVAVILVSLVSLCLATGVSLASRQFTKSIRYSEAQELYATLESLISTELRYTNEITYKDASRSEVDTFYSVTYALKDATTSLVSLDEDGNVTDNYGQLALGDEATNTFNRLLGKASYTNKLGAKVSVAYDETKKYFTVLLDIGTNENGSIVQKAFDVRTLNDVIIGENS